LFGYDLPALRTIFLWVGLPLAAGVAIYTAFLFAQAEGRDLWQSPLLPFHLLVQAFLVGAGAMLVVDLFLTFPAGWTPFLRLTFIIALLVDLFVTLVGEFAIPHASEVAA